MQRAFNLISAATGLVILAPLFAIISIAIKIEDGGQVLYSQLRVGRGFRKFRLYKFRSMAPHRADPISLTRSGDRRITKVGKFLRRHKLDELPQLMNILRGDMQLVGARPEVERYVEAFREQYAVILRDRPGITDPASLAYRHEDRVLGDGDDSDIERLYSSCILPRKLQLSLDYSEHRTLFSDLGIIARTVLGGGALARSSQNSGKCA